MTAFEFSVGLSAWLFAAVSFLQFSALPPGLIRVAFCVTIPPILLGLVYTALSICILFLRIALFVVFAMWREYVLLSVVFCAVLVVGIHWLLETRDTILNNPAAASSEALAAVVRFELVKLQFQVVVQGVVAWVRKQCMESEGRRPPVVSIVAEAPVPVPVPVPVEAPGLEEPETAVETPLGANAVAAELAAIALDAFDAFNASSEHAEPAEHVEEHVAEHVADHAAEHVEEQ